MKKTSIILWAFYLLAQLLALPLMAADASLCVIMKMNSYQQTGAATVNPLPGANFAEFGCFAQMTAPNSLTGGSVRSPLNQNYALAPDGDELNYGAFFDSTANMDAAYPNGNYTLSLTTAHDGNRSITVNLSGNAYPPTPQISNHAAAQTINPAAPFTLTWNAWPGGTANDIVILEIEDSQERTVFSSPGPGEPGGLNGLSNSVVIPAGTLNAGQTYSCWLTFFRPVAVDFITYPDATMVAGYGKTTGFAIAATTASGGADAQFIIVSKLLEYVQTNATTVEYEGAMDSAELSVFVEAAGVGRITNASVRNPLMQNFALVPEFEGSSLNFEAEFPTQAELDNAHPNGTYTVYLTGVNDGARAVDITLNGNAYPNAPRVANFASAQSIDPSQPFTLTWDPMIGGTTNDVIMMFIEDKFSDHAVFESPPPGEPGSLNGTATSITIPAGTFAAGRNYDVSIEFNRVVFASTTAYPGALVAGLYTKETTLPIRTFGEADTTPPQLWEAWPSWNEAGVSRSSGIAFRFTEPMQSGYSINWSIPGTFNMVWSADRTILFCYPSSDLLPANTTVSWALNPPGMEGFRDLAGNFLPMRQGQFTTGAQTDTQDIQQWVVYKFAYHQQTNATTVVLATNDPPYEFGAFVDSPTYAAVTSAALSGPASLGMEFEGDSWEGEARFDNLSQLNAAYPNGTYTFTVQSRLAGSRNLPINFPSGSFPNAPRINNYAAAQAINPAANFTLSWDAFSGATTNDIIIVEIDRMVANDEFTVFETPDFGESGALLGTATSVQIPANTLPPGRSLQARIMFIKVVQADATTVPGAWGAAAYVAMTMANITTTGQPVRALLSDLSFQGNQVQFRISGESNLPYRIEYSDDLRVWYTLFSNWSDQGVINVNDFSPLGARRFYRVVEGW